MKLSVSLSALLLTVPVLVSASSIPAHARGLNGDIYMPRNHARHFGRQRHGGVRQGGGKHGGATTSSSSSAADTQSTAVAADSQKIRKGGHRHGSSDSASATDSTTDSASATDSATDSASTTDSTTDSAGASSTSSAASASSTDDPQTSLTLLSNLVETGLEQNGQATQEPGQVPSLTSSNNFINFCAGKTITNGQQITTGSCNPIPMGDIIPKANMPSCKFINPVNQATVPANTPFTVQMQLNNMQAGVFTNAQKTYYMAPQQLNGQSILIGHSHFVIQKMGDFADPSILDPATFAFFKGIDDAGVNGVLSANVTAGLPAGNYRLASINTDSNHVPALGAVAQHGWFDDIVYFTAQ